MDGAGVVMLQMLAL
jgi:hypothetical protein